ncbi:CBO0543 family protein [Bacillus sp. USDA818B3_A]|uniref:CBO0543 family protein n=1 Tax=Bacillus sp. USDA818B3_A TaxID=2698834 RepID=UPI0019247AD6|nr:CBO0543 family protein [Bacillus sp. USDA818B3_A]
MNIAKHSNDSNLRPLQKKRLSFKYELGSMILAALLGTYLDLYFVGKELYHFPVRPFPEIFTINIAFTLIGLPLLTLMVLRCISKLTNWGKAGVILLVSLLMAIIERLFVLLGFFSHSEEWNHLYPFFCYGLFFVVVVLFQEWMIRNIN